mgnify:CR=1 FL=1
MRRCLAIVAALYLVSAVCADAGAGAVSVFVAPPIESAFIDARAEQFKKAHSALVDELRSKKKTILLVDSREDASVTVELVRVSDVVGETETRRSFVSGGIVSRQSRDVEVVARLSVQATEYTTELSASRTYEFLAARNVAVQVDKWIKANLAQLSKD